MNILAFDTETKGFDWWNGETAFIATTSDGTYDNAYDLSDPDQVHAFEQDLIHADVLVAHNLSFDVHQVRATLGIDLLNYVKVELHDTDLMARVMWPEGQYGEHGGFGLGPLTSAFLGRDGKAGKDAMAEAGKAIGYRTLNKTGAYYAVWRAYPEVVETYAKQDARDTWDLFQLLRAEAAKNPGLSDLYELERLVIPVLIEAERRGVAVDPVRSTHLHKHYKAAERMIETSLTKQLGDKALGGEGSQEALTDGLLSAGVPLTETTDTGLLATNQFALQRFESDYPIVAEFLEYRRIEKFLATYIEPLQDRDVVHTNFQQIGTWTGRMACRRPNMQNIPRGADVRDLFVARPGHKLIVADFEGIEARLLAYYLGPAGQAYRDLFNAGLDPHAWMASEIWGGDPADYLKGTAGADQRQDAKSVLFAIVFGAGGCRLCDMLNLDRGPPLKAGDWEVEKGLKPVGAPSCAQGKALARKVKKAIPGYGKLMRRIKTKIETVGYVTTIGGRKNAVARDKAYVGMSALIQGSAADCMKLGLVLAASAIEPWGAYPLLVVHDEFVAEVPADEAEEALAAMQLGMRAAGELYEIDPPLLTSGAIADSYGGAK